MKHKSKAKRTKRAQQRSATFEAQHAQATRVLRKLQAKIPDINKPEPERAWDIDAVTITVEHRLCRICRTTFECPPFAPMLKLSRPNSKHPSGARESRIGRLAKSEVQSVLQAGYAVEHKVVTSFVECCHLCTLERPAQVSSSPGVPRQLRGDTLLSGEDIEREATKCSRTKPAAPPPSLEDF